MDVYDRYMRYIVKKRTNIIIGSENEDAKDMMNPKMDATIDIRHPKYGMMIIKINVTMETIMEKPITVFT